MHKVLERIEANAQQLIDTYPSANMLLSDAMKESMVWVVPLVSSKKVPSLPQLEKLATQITAILMASTPDKSA